MGGCQLHAVKAGTGDTVCALRYVDGFANVNISVCDMDADGWPEITVGSAVYDTAGTL